MAVRYRTKGFVLKKEAKKEADQIFTLYTEDFGKIKVLGKAIRKIKSKLRGGVRLFSLSEIEFIRGKVYNTLTDAVIANNFKNIKEDLGKLKIAYKISEILDKLIKGEEPDKKIWSLLNEVFENLNSVDPSFSGKKLEILYYYFFWNLLSILGYRIDLYKCAFCQERLNLKLNYFNPEEGIICQSCLSAEYPAVPSRFQREKNGMRAGSSVSFTAGRTDIISPEIIKILRLFQKKDWQVLLKLKITAKYEKLLISASKNYLESLKI